MPNGIVQVPSTFTMQKSAIRTFGGGSPSFDMHRAMRRAAIFAASSLVAPVQVTFPEDQMEAVV